MKIVLIDDENLYSYNLCKSLASSDKKANVFLYSPISGGNKFSYRIPQSKKVWTTYLFPLQIFKQSVIDKPDIVHIQYEVNTFGPLYANLLFPILLLLLKISRTKVVITIHSVVENVQKETLPDSFQSFAPALLKLPLTLFYNLIAKLSNTIIVHSSVFNYSLVSSFKLNPKKIRIIPHGVEVKKPEIDKSKVEKWASVLSHRKIVLFFGVLTPRKGLEYLIKGFSKIASLHPESVLLIAGFEPTYYRTYEKSLQTLSVSMGLNDKVVFTGFIEDDDANTLFSMAEIVVLPYAYSLSASGPLSIAIQHRKPIVATRTAFFNETLKDGYDALLVPPMDYESLGQAIDKLLSDHQLKQRLSINIDLKAQNSSWDKVAKTTLDTYRAL